MRSVKNIWTSIKTIGAWPYSVYVLGRMLRAMSCGDAVHYRLVAVDLKALLASGQAADGKGLVPLKRGDPRLEHLDVSAEIVRERMAQGAVCLALSKGAQLQGCIWYSTDRYNEDEVRAQFVLPRSAIWDFGAYIAPEHRLSRCFDQLWRGFARYSWDQGARYSISRIATHNLASMRSHSRLPHTILGHCSFIRLFSLQLCLSPLLERWHICRSDKDMPVFEVHL